MISIDRYTGPKAPNYIALTLAPGAMASFDGVAFRFYVVEADGVLTIKASNTSPGEYTARQGLEADPTALFERIEITNNTAADITFRVFYGWGTFLDGTSELLGNVSVTNPALSGATVPCVTAPKQTATAPDTFAIEAIDQTVFTLAAGERGFIQNLGTAPLFVKLGAAAAANSFSFILAPGAADDDGTGEKVWIDDWVGDVSVFSTGPRYIAWKRAI